MQCYMMGVLSIGRVSVIVADDRDGYEGRGWVQIRSSIGKSQSAV